MLCSAPHDLSSLSRTAEAASRGRGRIARKSRGFQGPLNSPTCYFYCILLANQVKRPDKVSRLVVLWPIKFKTLWISIYFFLFLLLLFSWVSIFLYNSFHETYTQNCILRHDYSLDVVTTPGGSEFCGIMPLNSPKILLSNKTCS